MPREHQINARLFQFLIFTRLMVEHYHIFIRVKPLHKLCCRSPAAPPLRLRTILSSNHIKAVIQQDRFILKHDNAVLFKLRNQVIPVKPPVICAIIAPVMVAENIVHPVGGLKCTKCPARIHHILPFGIIINIIPGNHHDIRIFRLHLRHIFRKTLTVKCCPDMGIRNMDDSQCPHFLFGINRIFRPKNMVCKHKSHTQINNSKY